MQHISVDQIGNKIDEHCVGLKDGSGDYLSHADAIFVANKYYRSFNRNINQDVMGQIRRASEQSTDRRISKVELRNIINNLQHTYGSQDPNSHSGQNSQVSHNIHTSQVVNGSTLYRSELNNEGSVTRLSNVQRRPSYTSRPAETVTTYQRPAETVTNYHRPAETVTTYQNGDHGFVGSRRSIRFESNMTSGNGTLSYIGETRTYGDNGNVTKVVRGNDYTKSYVDGGSLGSQTQIRTSYGGVHREIGGTSYTQHAPVTTTYTIDGERQNTYSNRGSNTRVIREGSLNTQTNQGGNQHTSVHYGHSQQNGALQHFADHTRQPQDQHNYNNAQSHVSQHDTQHQLNNSHQQHFGDQQQHSGLQQQGYQQQQHGEQHQQHGFQHQGQQQQGQQYQQIGDYNQFQGQQQQDHQQYNGNQTQHQGHQQQQYGSQGQQQEHHIQSQSQHQSQHQSQSQGQFQNDQAPRLGVVSNTNYSIGYPPSNYQNVDGYTSELKNVNLRYSGLNQDGQQQQGGQAQQQHGYNNVNGQNYNRA